MSDEFRKDCDRELADALAESRPAEVPGLEHRGVLARELTARALAAAQSDDQIWSAQRYLTACAIVAMLAAIMGPLGASLVRPSQEPLSDLPCEFAALYGSAPTQPSIDWKAEIAALPKFVPVMWPRVVNAQLTIHHNGDRELRTLKDGGM